MIFSTELYITTSDEKNLTHLNIEQLGKLLWELSDFNLLLFFLATIDGFYSFVIHTFQLTFRPLKKSKTKNVKFSFFNCFSNLSDIYIYIYIN